MCILLCFPVTSLPQYHCNTVTDIYHSAIENSILKLLSMNGYSKEYSIQLPMHYLDVKVAKQFVFRSDF